MKSLTALLATALLVIALPALAKDADEPKKPATFKDYAILKVGNDKIMYSEVLDVWKSLFPGGAVPDFNSFDENIRQNVLRGMVSEHLIYAQAVKAGTEDDAAVKKRIAAMTKQVIMQAFMEDKAKSLVTDADLKAAYEKKVDAAKGQEEIKAKHILVPTEDEAKEIETQLKKGADFDALAKEKSTDKGSSIRGGDLGWFTKDKMVPEFANAAFKLKVGEISDPVKTAFGWHVIQVEGRRPVQLPSFDSMKDSLREQLANQAVQDYVEALLKKADVKYYGPNGEERPFSLSLEPAKPASADEDE